MSDSTRTTQFADRPIREFDPTTGLINPQAECYRVSSRPNDSAESVEEKLDRLLDDPRCCDLAGLVINLCDPGGQTPCDRLISRLVGCAKRLPQLRAFALADLTHLESSAGLDRQLDLSTFWEAFRHLEYVRLRGELGLILGELSLPQLRSLAIETSGMPQEVLHQLTVSEVPALRELELWLGTEDWGSTVTPADVEALLTRGRFPQIRNLSLCGSDMADDLAQVVVGCRLVKRLSVLSLAWGNLQDEGGQAILHAGTLNGLTRLDLRGHRLSSRMETLLQRGLSCRVDLSEGRGAPQRAQRSQYDDGHYTEISE